jgi:hypothetical protein
VRFCSKLGALEKSCKYVTKIKKFMNQWEIISFSCLQLCLDYAHGKEKRNSLCEMQV